MKSFSLRWIWAAFLWGITTASAGSAASQPADPQSDQVLNLHDDLSYLQYLPPGYNDDAPDATHGGTGHGWPLVIFLHGSGQCGSDLEQVKQDGLPQLVAQGRQHPFILLSPQVAAGGWWEASRVLKLLDHAEQTLHVDHDRIYITGLSLGGFGAWDVARRANGRLAAIVPIAGGGDADYFATHSAASQQLAVWAFHGADDNAVPARRSKEMIDALHAAGNLDAKLTIYPGVGHPSWHKAYDDPELFRWMLAQHRRELPATAPTTQAAKR